MTPAEISALSDDELQKALAEALRWTKLDPGPEIPGEAFMLYGVWPDDHIPVPRPVPDYPRDPAASAELRRELWRRRAYHLTIGWSPISVSISIDCVREGVRREYDAFVPMSIGADPIVAECLAVARAALAALTEGGKC